MGWRPVYKLASEREVCSWQGRLALYKEMRVGPNRAFCERGCAARERGREFRRKIIRPQCSLDGDAVPLADYENGL